MTKRLLLCSYEDWDVLARAVDKAKTDNGMVRVPRGALDRLMKDHSHFVNENKRDLTGDL